MPTLALTEKLNSVKICVATRRKEGCAFMNALRWKYSITRYE